MERQHGRDRGRVHRLRQRRAGERARQIVVRLRHGRVDRKHLAICADVPPALQLRRDPVDEAYEKPRCADSLCSAVFRIAR